MGKFLHSCQKDYLSKAHVLLKARAEELEASVPRWSVVFQSGDIDCDLAKTRVPY